MRIQTSCQKAPSAKRRIKTHPYQGRRCTSYRRQKAPSAKRCIKTLREGPIQSCFDFMSESKERQKVH